MEHNHVHKIYESIAEEFNDTRYCYWNSVKNILDSLSINSLVADVGCGNGKYMKYDTERLHYIGIDMCQSLLEINKDKDVIRGNALTLPYRDNIFDTVICIAVMHHIYLESDRIKFIQNLIKICKPNGIIHITVWADTLKKSNMKNLGNGDYFIGWKNKHDRYYHLFNKKEIIELMKHCKNITYKIEYEMENWCITINV